MLRNSSALEWAQSEFGAVDLGDERRTRRLVQLAAAAAERPRGKISELFNTDGAGKEAAYRFLEKQGSKEKRLEMSAGVAAFRRAWGENVVVVPVDGTSATASPHSGPKTDFGPVGNRTAPSRGLTVMSAILVTLAGTTLGTAAQSFWAREEKRKRRNRAKRRLIPFEEKETVRWLEVSENALEAAKQAGFKGMLWFQDDRGADFAEMLAWATTQGNAWVTVRSAQDRTVVDGVADRLWAEVEAQPVKQRFRLPVPGGHKRKARKAQMELRFFPVVLELPKNSACGQIPVPLHAVHVREVMTTPLGDEKPIEWLLLTTRPINSTSDARKAVKAYSLRWRIEEVHKTWKSITRVEDSQLQTAGPFALWGRILFCVSTRIERLKRLSRETPDLPATTEFSPQELEAVSALLLDKDKYLQKKAPTLADTVDAIARLGGYMGKSSGGPPGHITISRGMDQVLTAVAALQAVKRRQIRRRKM